MRRTVRLALAGLLFATAPLQAQVLRHLTAGLDAGSARLRAAPVTGGAEELSGVILGGGGSLLWNRFSLEVSYAQGNLTADSGNAAPRDLVEGSVLLAARPVSWATILIGPHLRAYVDPAATRRLKTMEARVRAEGPLIGDMVRAHVEVWRSLSASVNSGVPLDYLQGGSAGLTVRLPRAPIWGRLSYSIDQATTTDGGKETLDGIRVAIGFGGR